MSKADILYRETCMKILNEGFSDADLQVRPVWDDGTPAHTIKTFGIVNRYDLSKEFPIMTLRKTYWKSAIDELLWIWQKKSNRIAELGSHVWDEWADENGTIGKAYGYQIGQTYVHHVSDKENDLDMSKFPSAKWEKRADGRYNVYLDQIDGVIYDLTYNRASRRIMTNIYNFRDLHEMGLYPCAYSMTFNVTGNKLNGMLNQRSQDMLTANNWNVVQYAALTHMLAQVTGLEVGEFVHIIADCHIYDRHIPLVEEMLKNEEFEAPQFVIDPSIKNFYDFTKDSFKMVGYKCNEFNHKIPMAI